MGAGHDYIDANHQLLKDTNQDWSGERVAGDMGSGGRARVEDHLPPPAAQGHSPSLFGRGREGKRLLGTGQDAQG